MEEEVKKSKDLLKLISIIIFILSIISFFVSLFIDLYLSKIDNYSLVCHSWIFLCFIILPILLIIIELIKIIRKRKCNKFFFISGIIIFLLLFIFGGNYFIPFSNSRDFDKFEKILGVRLPKRVLRIKASYYDVNIDKYKTKYYLSVSDFSKKDSSKFTKYVLSDNDWKKTTEIDSKFFESIPINIKVDENNYIYKYNENTSEMNIYEFEVGNNYLFIYNISTRHFEVHNYKLEEK